MTSEKTFVKVRGVERQEPKGLSGVDVYVAVWRCGALGQR